MMATSSMLWGGAAYNNGILQFKRYILGEAYGENGVGALIKNPVVPTPEMTKMGILPSLAPRPRGVTIPPADVFRVFEQRGGRVINTFPEVGLPNSTGALQNSTNRATLTSKIQSRARATGQRIAVPVISITRRA